MLEMAHKMEAQSIFMIATFSYYFMRNREIEGSVRCKYFLELRTR